MKGYFKRIFVVVFSFIVSFYIDALTVINDDFLSYNDISNKDNIDLVPSETLNIYETLSRNYFNSNLSSPVFGSSLTSFDLRNDSGKRNVPSIDNQENLSLCWAFSTNNTIESYLLKNGYPEYNFSENQMDYVARYLKDSNTFGGANSIINVLKYWYYGYSPVNESYFGEYFTNYKDKKIYEYMDSTNTSFDVLEAIWFPTFDIESEYNKYNVTNFKNQLSNYIKNIKDHLVNYGAIATGIYTDFYNKETNLLYNDGSSDYESYAKSSHAVTIIGWDDNYGSVNYKGNTFKGSWLAMNSWGNNTEYFYISYYDIDVYKYLIGVNNVKEKTYDNIYSNYLDSYNNNDIDTYKYYIGNEKETVLGVKVMYYENDNANISIKVSDGITTKTSNRNESLHYGINYFDIDDFITDDNGYLYVYVNNKDSVYYELSVITKNSDSGMKYYTITNDSFINKVGNLTKYHLISKNIKSGTNYEIKVIDSYNNDITNNFTIIKNVNLINNYSNFTLKLNNVLSNTKYYIQVYSNGYVDFVIDDSYIEGSGTLDSPYLIKKMEDLKHLSNSSDYFKLMIDIDLRYDTTNIDGYYYNNTKGFIPFDFNGHLDGNNHTISNLNSYVGGLFGKLKNANISNLKIDNFNIDVTSNEYSYSGILSSYLSNSIINNVEINNSYINSSKTVGSIAGQAENNIDINNILINSNLNSNDNIGGLFGNVIVNNDKNISIKNTFINDTKLNNYSDIYKGSLIGYLLILSKSSNINIINNNTYSNCNNIIGSISNIYNISYNYENNNVINDIYNIDNFNLYDFNIWKYSNSNSLYLSSFPKSNIVIPKINISFNNYDINNDLIYITRDYNMVRDIIDDVIIDSKLSYEFYNIKNNILNDNNYIGTGSYIKVSNGREYKNYYFIINGDINGDGIVNIVDSMMCANNVLDDNISKDSLKYKASDFDNNDRIDIVDVIKISNYILR